MRVVFSDRAYVSVLAETTEEIKTETGGLFLGTHIDGTWFIVEAIDPGPNSVFEVAYFEYDQAYTQHLIRKVANLYAAELHLIGLWHRHPGSFDVFSSTDDGTNAKYAKLNDQGAVSALVNIDPTFRITMYHVDRPCKYSKIKYEVGDELFPAELLKFKEASTYEALMKKISSSANAVSQQNTGYHKSASFAGFLKTLQPYLNDYLCKEMLAEPELDGQNVRERMVDALFDDIAFISDEVGIEITVLQREKCIVIAQEAMDEVARLYFGYSEKDEQVVFEYDGKNYFYTSGLFKKLFQQTIEDKQRKPAHSAKPTGVDKKTNRSGANALLRLLGVKNGGTDDEKH